MENVTFIHAIGGRERRRYRFPILPSVSLYLSLPPFSLELYAYFRRVCSIIFPCLHDLIKNPPANPIATVSQLHLPLYGGRQSYKLFDRLTHFVDDFERIRG